MEPSGPNPDDIALQFTIRQMAIGIAVIGVILALAVQVPRLVLAVGDVILVGFGSYKVARAVLAKDAPADEPPWPPVWFRIAIAMVLAVMLLGILIACLFPVASP